VIIVDNLQYANWSEKIFLEMNKGSVDAVHVTVAYHENFRETILNLEKWNTWFERFPKLIMKGITSDDILLAHTHV
jgi:membrane dipeptidase